MFLLCIVIQERMVQVASTGPFLDNQGGLGILDVANEAQALEILAHDPAVLAQFLEAHVHPWHVAFNRYPAQSSQSGA